jgi:serine/threonine protein phosphatase 1
MLQRLFGARRAPSPTLIPEGRRVYAVGDVHGRLDLLDALLTQVDADDRTRGPADTTLIFLGDLVDRGPDSAGVVERLLLESERRADMHVLMGNHEEIFLDALDGDDKALRLFCRVGGRETAISYGMTPDAYESADYPTLLEQLRQQVPERHRAFLSRFQDMVTIGDFAFVHAGVRPGVALEAQQPSDLRWIRAPFLQHRGTLDKMIVHGHTIEPEVAFEGHRIGIDTGAYQTGRLTALGLEGDQRWILDTGADGGV